MGLPREQVTKATKLDLSTFNENSSETLLTYSEEAALKAEKQARREVAQKLFKKGWASEEIAETTGLDLPTVESLYTQS